MENNIKKHQECCSRNSSTSATRHSPISKHSPVSKHLPASKQNSSSYQDNNINDVCFGCDGGCSDATCSRNAHPRSVQMWRTCDQSPLSSPKQNLETMSEKSSPDIDLSSRPETGSGSCSCSPVTSPAEILEDQSKPVREKDSYKNLNY
ncbi:mitogen-activated protein kinase kinase kinase 12 [Biomphalaria glabrata]|nr:mitogen-activated protein kinase kinase kinase 12 [Biomphalaria glabrata]